MLPKVNREDFFDLRVTRIQMSWNKPSTMKKNVAATKP